MRRHFVQFNCRIRDLTSFFKFCSFELWGRTSQLAKAVCDKGLLGPSEACRRLSKLFAKPLFLSNCTKCKRPDYSHAIQVKEEVLAAMHARPQATIISQTQWEHHKLPAAGNSFHKSS